MTRVSVMMLAGALAGVSPLALACPDEPARSGEAVVLMAAMADEPRPDRVDADHVHVQEIRSSDGKRFYEVVIRGDKVSAKVDGLRIADDRIRRTEGRVIILDDEGKELNTFRLEAPDAPRPPAAMNWRFGIGDDNDIGVTAQAGGPPPVMLGVILGDPDEALRAQLGVSEHAIVVERVYDGLPAAKAGLKPYDIVTAVNGTPLDADSSLRDVLRDSEPGDTLTMVVVRRAKEIEVEVELAAYDAQALAQGSGAAVPGSPVAPAAPAPPAVPLRPLARGFTWQDFGEDMGLLGVETAERALAETKRQLESWGKDSPDAERAARDIERAMRELEAKREQLRSEGARSWLSPSGDLFRVPRENAFPGAGDGARARLEERLAAMEAELDERLADIESRLADRLGQMESAFDRIIGRLERMMDERPDRE